MCLCMLAEPAFQPYNWSDPLRVETTLLNEEEQQIMSGQQTCWSEVSIQG